MPTLTPSAADALFDQFAGRQVTDPKDYATANPKRVDGKFLIKPVQDELLKLISLAVGGGFALPIRNATGGTLDAGTLVYVSGYDATEGKFLVTKADADDQDKTAQLVLTADLTTATNGLAYPFATVTGLDTSGASAVGDPVYLSGTAGLWTLSAPASPANKQRIGVVMVKDAATGEIHFFPGAGLQERLGAGNPFADNAALVKGATSATKQMRIDVETAVSAGQTRVLKMPDANIDLTPGTGDFADADVSATDKVLGRSSAGAGKVEEIPCTSSGRAVMAAASAGAQKVLIGVVGKNLLINGDFRVAQRGTTFTSSGAGNANDSYNLDRWNHVCDDVGDVVDISQEATVVPTGAFNSLKLDVETANLKFGQVQIIEAKNCKRIIGGVASLQFKVRTSNFAKLDSVKAAILAWDDTADAVTSAVVANGDWGAEGTEPTWASHWTREGIVTQALAASDTWYTVKLENVAIDTANAKNVAVFIWSDVTDTTAGDFLYIADVQLEPGSVATEFEARDIATEMDLCEWHVRRVILKGDATFVIGYSLVGYGLVSNFYFPRMRSAPTASYSGGTVTYVNCSGFSISTPTESTFQILVSVTSNGVAYAYPATTDGVITLESEL